jgi:hypothetical protein
MKKAILTIALLGIAVAAYAGTALGAGTATGSEEGQLRFMSSDRCNLVFGFHGFAPGTKGRLEIRINGSIATLDFVVPQSGVRGFRLHGFIAPTKDPVKVEYRIGVDGMRHVMSGVTMANCDCMPEGGGGNHGGGGGPGEGTTSAGAATPISGQPGFAG